MVMIVHLISRHVLYAVGLTSLPSRVRTAMGSPYASFVLVLACDYLALILALNGVINWKEGALASRADLWQTAKELFTSEKLKGMLSGREPSLVEVLVGSSGLLYYATVFGTVLRFKDFKRTDEDYRSLAQMSCILGHFNEALRLLQNVKTPTREANTLRAVAYLGVDQFERAYQTVKETLRANGKDPSADQIFSALGDALVSVAFPRDRFIAFVKNALKLSIADGRLIAALEQEQVDQAAAEDLLHVVEETALQSRFPLSHALLLQEVGRLVESRAALEKAKPSNPLEEIIRACLVLYAGIRDPATSLSQDAAYFEQWSERYSVAVSGAIARVTDSDERLIAWSQMFSVAITGEKLKSHRAQSWSYLADEVKRAIAADPLRAEVLEALQGMEALAQRRLHRDIWRS